VRKFGVFSAVDGIDLRVERWIFFGFLGPSGAGKSTTANPYEILLMERGIHKDSGSRDSREVIAALIKYFGYLHLIDITISMPGTGGCRAAWEKTFILKSGCFWFKM